VRVGGQHLWRIAAAPVGFAALEVRQHRPRLERNGAAVMLDGDERLPAAEGFVTLRDKPAVILVALDGLVGEHHGRDQPRHDHAHRDEFLHSPARW
jgi:hypothetical protein